MVETLLKYDDVGRETFDDFHHTCFLATRLWLYWRSDEAPISVILVRMRFVLKRLVTPHLLWPIESIGQLQESV